MLRAHFYQRSRALRILCSGLATIFAAMPPSPAGAWETAHGLPDNTGFVDVATAKANTPLNVMDIGSVAFGAGPVVGPDGTVYLGNEQGKLMTFSADGTPGWSRELRTGQSIIASPAIGVDGMIYVIGVEKFIDHRVDPPVRVARAALHRFTSGGGYLGSIAFPEHNGDGLTTAWPSLWRFNGTELVIVPALYRRPVGGGVDIRLLAFTPSGGLAADHLATSITPTITGGMNAPKWAMPFCLIPPVTLMCAADPTFTPALAVDPAPFPGVGIFTNPAGGTPFILLTDYDKTVMGLTFSDGAFVERFRVKEKDRFMRAAPTFLPDGRSIIGTQDVQRSGNGTESGGLAGGAIFSGPNMTATTPITGLEPTFGVPTRLPNGRTLLVGAHSDLTVLAAGRIIQRIEREDGASSTSAAASRTHVFVATNSAFKTFDPVTLAEVETMSWTKGGKNPPVIGPQGHVYAIADNRLFVFAPGKPMPATAGGSGTVSPLGGGVLQDAGQSANPPPTNPPPSKPTGGVFQDSGIPMPQSAQSQSYKPPMTANNNRLFACEELDGDDCGKGDHRAISLAFCQKQGFAKADDFDVDSRKVKAETLDGRLCSKNKCKVFEEIVCKM
jgi:hypothetical protein